MHSIVHTEYDVNWLPKPNRIEVVIATIPAPPDLTRTAFVLPMLDDRVVLTSNKRRGTDDVRLEIPGGHINHGETMEGAAVRECREETGAFVDSLRPLGFIRMTSGGTPPEGWKYPHPISYQQFFLGRVVGFEEHTEDDECGTPVILAHADAGRLEMIQRAFWNAARMDQKQERTRTKNAFRLGVCTCGEECDIAPVPMNQWREGMILNHVTAPNIANIIVTRSRVDEVRPRLISKHTLKTSGQLYFYAEGREINDEGIEIGERKNLGMPLWRNEDVEARVACILRTHANKNAETLKERRKNP